MTRPINGSWLVAGTLGIVLMGCQSGGVGDPCTPEDEYQSTFSGFDVGEVNVESRSYQCETRVCLVNHFQGRTTCPYGQAEGDITNAPDQLGCPPDATCDPNVQGKIHWSADNHRCHIPGTKETIQVPVDPQFVKRQTDTAVYCSCRCDGPDPNAKYCQCPSGFSCTPLVQDLGLGSGQLAGSYCVKDGTVYKKGSEGAQCDYGKQDGDLTYCGNPDPNANNVGVNP